MPIDPVTHVPVVAGTAYAERILRLSSKTTVTLKAEPGNRFNPAAVAVQTDGQTIGYLPPEISRHYFESLNTMPGAPAVECQARRAPVSARENTGVELLIDLSGIPCAP